MKYLSILLAGTLCCAGYALGQEPNNPPPTFNKDVAPILQKHCQTCHRPGEAAPFSMLTYEETRPWAPTIKMVVTQRIMPPWFADSQYGHFANERSLSADEIRTLVAWVNGGAQKGAAENMPPPTKSFVEGWGIPTPDTVFQHIIAYLREPGSNYFKDQKPGVFSIAPPPKVDEKTDTSALPSDFLVGYAPGQPAEILHPGEGKLIKAGSDIVFEVHYTPNGKPTTDQTKLGLVFTKTPPNERVLTLSASK